MSKNSAVLCVAICFLLLLTACSSPPDLQPTTTTASVTASDATVVDIEAIREEASIEASIAASKAEAQRASSVSAEEEKKKPKVPTAVLQTVSAQELDEYKQTYSSLYLWLRSVATPCMQILNTCVYLGSGLSTPLYWGYIPTKGLIFDFYDTVVENNQEMQGMIDNFKDLPGYTDRYQELMDCCRYTQELYDMVVQAENTGWEYKEFYQQSKDQYLQVKEDALKAFEKVEDTDFVSVPSIDPIQAQQYLDGI